MRVLEAGSVHTYKMGKNRKHRIRKNKENEAEESSDEGSTGCTHITKAVNCAAMRKAILKPTVTYGECTTCTLDASRSGARDLFGSPLEGTAGAAVEDSDVEPTVWVCLQCGHQGCDRNSREKHALKHYETPHSGMHCIVVNLTMWSAWCYACDNDVPVENKRVQECVDFLRKQAGLPRLCEMGQFAAQRAVQTASQSDVSPTDYSPPAIQSRSDKAQVSARSPAVVCQKVKGLSNLGNTCFFNAVMQNLCQTHSLESLLVSGCKKGRVITIPGHDSDSDSSVDGEDEEDSRDKLKELSAVEISCGDPGPLTQALLYFVQEMNNGSTQGTVNPNALFSHVCKKAPRFKGFQQQDSHELLRYLLDVIRNEEIKRAQGGILKYFKLSESINPKKVDDETKLKVKEYGRRVKYTFLDSLFGGQLVSTVMCEECKHISQIFEPFLDLSLPVTEEKPQRPNQMLGGKRKDVAAAGDVHEEQAPSSGVDGFAERADRPSKYQERKNRKQAKKEAKRKSRVAGRKGRGGQQVQGAGGGDMEEEEEEKDADGGEDDPGDHLTDEQGDKGKVEGEEQQGESGRSLDADDDNSSPQDDPSDADVEDNLESETSRLQTPTTGNYNNLSTNAHVAARSSNLNNRNDCESDVETSASDLQIKSLTEKENHILPADLSESEESQPASLDNMAAGIKDPLSKSVEKLANGISNIELDHLECVDAHRIADGLPRLPQFSAGHENHVGNGEEGGISVSEREGLSMLPTSAAADVGSKVTPAHKEFQDHSDSSVKENGPSTAFHAAEAGVADTGLEKDLVEKLVIGGEAGGDAFSSCPCADRKTACHSHVGKTQKELQRDARYKSQTTLAHRYHPSSKECSVMSCLHQFTAAELLTGSNKVGCKMCTRLRPKNSTPHKDKKGSDQVYSNASKQFLILVPPAILTLHLKRFEQVGYTSRKVNRHVEFPTILDIAPYCSSLCQDVRSGQRRVLYSLYGVVEHSGRLSGGHYTAYVKVRPSLGPLTNFIHTHQPNPREFIHRYMEQVQKTACSTEDEAADDPSPEVLVPPGRWFHISDSRINEVTEATVLKAQAYLLFYERIC
ncbi:hypothetical protein BaRGS_00017215 [Batillaria attramentaria]|uniref:ubiquitinyl hydrolase 1 n=1 Tax=Batillaria attramentaria TaxID=370345 RepID=A0ABD0KW95_9CAEN